MNMDDSLNEQVEKFDREYQEFAEETDLVYKKPSISDSISDSIVGNPVFSNKLDFRIPRSDGVTASRRCSI